MRRNKKADLHRCDQEIEFILSGGYGTKPNVLLNYVGVIDWETEKYFIEKEHAMQKEVRTHMEAIAHETGFRQVSIETAMDLDAITAAAVRTEPEYTAAIARLKDPNTVRLLHAAMGLVTESGELLDMLKKHIFYGKPIDRVNAIEEMGDASWYQRIGLEALDVNYAEMLLINVRKLRARFPDKFTEEAALNRDLDKERGVLEGKGE